MLILIAYLSARTSVSYFLFVPGRNLPWYSLELQPSLIVLCRQTTTASSLNLTFLSNSKDTPGGKANKHTPTVETTWNPVGELVCLPSFFHCLSRLLGMARNGEEWWGMARNGVCWNNYGGREIKRPRNVFKSVPVWNDRKDNLQMQILVSSDSLLIRLNKY